MNISDDVRCECGHIYQDHVEEYGDDPHDYCMGDQNTEQGCDCTHFEAAEIQDFGGHPFKPTRRKYPEISEGALWKFHEFNNRG